MQQFLHWMRGSDKVDTLLWDDFHVREQLPFSRCLSRGNQHPNSRLAMFEDSTFESGGKIKTKSGRWMMFTGIVNGSILLLLILIPLIYPEALHREAMAT
ncbi:MAG: hypothetical protein WBE38_03040, partial [Terracidiphilus sp.]